MLLIAGLELAALGIVLWGSVRWNNCRDVVDVSGGIGRAGDDAHSTHC